MSGIFPTYFLYLFLGYFFKSTLSKLPFWSCWTPVLCCAALGTCPPFPPPKSLSPKSPPPPSSAHAIVDPAIHDAQAREEAKSKQYPIFTRFQPARVPARVLVFLPKQPAEHLQGYLQWFLLAFRRAKTIADTLADALRAVLAKKRVPLQVPSRVEIG